jgi:hypothetical protein
VEQDIDDRAGTPDEGEAAGIQILSRQRLGIRNVCVDVGQSITATCTERAAHDKGSPTVDRLDGSSELGDHGGVVWQAASEFGDPCLVHPPSVASPCSTSLRGSDVTTGGEPGPGRSTPRGSQG